VRTFIVLYMNFVLCMDMTPCIASFIAHGGRVVQVCLLFSVEFKEMWRSCTFLFKQIELPAKLLDSFLWNNKSNINQTKAQQDIKVAITKGLQHSVSKNKGCSRHSHETTVKSINLSCNCTFFFFHLLQFLGLRNRI